MSKDLISNLNDLQSAFKSYVQTKIDLTKLTILEKISRIVTVLISSLVIVLISVFIVVFSVVTFVVWYNNVFHNLIEGLLFGIAILIVLLVIFIVFRNRWVTSILIRSFSKIIYEEEDEE